MPSTQNFDDSLSKWKLRIDKGVSDVKSNKKPQFQHIKQLYEYMRDFQEIFYPLVDKIPTTQSKWVTGNDLSLNIETHFAFESLQMALYLLSCNLYYPANYSSRCAIEQIFSTLYSIIDPSGTVKASGSIQIAKEFGGLTHKEIRERIFNIPRYYSYVYEQSHFIPLDKDSSCTLKKFVENTYSNLSMYVHSRTRYKQDPLYFPGKIINPTFEHTEFEHTLDNITNSLIIIISLIYISVYEEIDTEIMDKLKETARGQHVLESIFNNPIK